MVTYKSRLRSINQQFNFQGSTGLIARFGASKGRRREKQSRGRRWWWGRTGQGSESEHNLQIHFSLILPGKRHYCAVVKTETAAGLEKEKGRGHEVKDATLYPLAFLRPHWVRIPLLADWSCSLHVRVCLCTSGNRDCGRLKDWEHFHWLGGGRLPLTTRPRNSGGSSRIMVGHPTTWQTLHTTHTHTCMHTTHFFFFSSLFPSLPPLSVCCVPPPWALRVH